MPNLADLTTPLRHERDMSKIAGRVGDVLNARFDVVADQGALHFDKMMNTSMLRFNEPTITSNGVIDGDLVAPYTRTAIRQVADRLRIPLSYLDRLISMEHDGGRELAAHSLNELAYMDGRRALYRYLNTDDGHVLRAVLSDRYQAIDNDLALQAIMVGLNDQGLNLTDCEVEGDVTEDRLRLRIAVPSIEVHAADLLGDYRMPFSMDQSQAIHAQPLPGETPPVVWAGVEIGNSETGHGAYYVAPRIVVKVCRNGLVRPVELRKAHVGAVLESGTIDWSNDTRENAMRLLTSQTTDAVRSYLSVEYVESEVEKMRAAKAVQVGTGAIEVVQERFGLTESETANVLDCFARGGDLTAFGVGQAVTAAAQLAEDGDRQAEMEQVFWQIIERPMAVAVA